MLTLSHAVAALLSTLGFTWFKYCAWLKLCSRTDSRCNGGGGEGEKQVGFSVLWTKQKAKTSHEHLSKCQLTFFLWSEALVRGMICSEKFALLTGSRNKDRC